MRVDAEDVVLRHGVKTLNFRGFQASTNCQFLPLYYSTYVLILGWMVGLSREKFIGRLLNQTSCCGIGNQAKSDRSIALPERC